MSADRMLGPGREIPPKKPTFSNEEIGRLAEVKFQVSTGRRREGYLSDLEVRRLEFIRYLRVNGRIGHHERVPTAELSAK